MARTAWVTPTAVFATRIHNASRQSPKAGVSAPNVGQDEIGDDEDVGAECSRTWLAADSPAPAS
jgi:hypothetical protein